MGFSGFFWLLVEAFVFACYLIVLFQVVVDLFRDENLSGWWKAVWIIFLIILPFAWKYLVRDWAAIRD